MVYIVTLVNFKTGKVEDTKFPTYEEAAQYQSTLTLEVGMASAIHEVLELPRFPGDQSRR